MPLGKKPGVMLVKRYWVNPDASKSSLRQRLWSGLFHATLTVILALTDQQVLFCLPYVNWIMETHPSLLRYDERLVNLQAR